MSIIIALAVMPSIWLRADVEWPPNRTEAVVVTLAERQFERAMPYPDGRDDSRPRPGARTRSDGAAEASPKQVPSTSPELQTLLDRQQTADDAAQTTRGVIGFLWVLYGGALCFLLAEKRGRHPWPWAIVGLFLTIPAVLALLVLRRPKSGQPEGG